MVLANRGLLIGVTYYFRLEDQVAEIHLLLWNRLQLAGRSSPGDATGADYEMTSVGDIPAADTSLPTGF